MYRILRDQGEVRERRRQATHPARKKPELIATRPNEVYSWDITKLLGPQKWTYYYLYVVIDIYSRYVPGWMLARAERAHLAERLLADTITNQGVARDKRRLVRAKEDDRIGDVYRASHLSQGILVLEKA